MRPAADNLFDEKGMFFMKYTDLKEPAGEEPAGRGLQETAKKVLTLERVKPLLLNRGEK